MANKPPINTGKSESVNSRTVPLKIFTAAELMKDYVPLPKPENAPPLSLLQIISIEPRIALVLIALKPSRSNQKWYKQYSKAKSELCKLVGWQAEKFDLRTSQAYDVVLDTVIEKLDG